MSSYILVRTLQTRRQKEDETVHLVRDGNSETVCGEIGIDSVRSIRTIPLRDNPRIVCTDCSNAIEDLV